MRIAYVTDWTDPRQWTKYATQKSAAINLTAGQKYYVEVLHKEATGGDHFAVAWEGPGIPLTVIGGNLISPFVVGSGTSFSLAVTKAGAGTGTVTSSPTGISCGSTCSASYASGTAVTLTSAAASGSTFAGWSGACTGTGTCALSMTAARAVTATFNTTGTGTTCANPVTFTNNTGNFNTTGAACYRTASTVSGWGCSNFDGRTVTVGGVARTCGQLPVTKSSDGYYYFSVTAGTYPWASLYTWLCGRDRLTTGVWRGLPGRNPRQLSLHPRR